jgi:hypothetical protein
MAITLPARTISFFLDNLEKSASASETEKFLRVFAGYGFLPEPERFPSFFMRAARISSKEDIFSREIKLFIN